MKKFALNHWRNFLGALPSETQGHRAIRYKSGHAPISRASGFPLLSLARLSKKMSKDIEVSSLYQVIA
jgi:hypothetical protein